MNEKKKKLTEESTYPTTLKLKPKKVKDEKIIKFNKEF